MGPSRNFVPQGKLNKRGLRLRKNRKKKRQGIKSERVDVKQPPLHQGPRYNISFAEVNKAYGRMRKGKGFFASKKVLWRNRHALVLGSSNFYRKVRGDDDSYYQEDNIEYDVVEPLSKNMTGAPPLKMAPNSLWVTAVFGSNIFVFFGKKPNNCEFTAVHHVLSELFTKSILHLVIPFCVIFLTKTKVVPLGFFQILIKNHDF